MRQYICSGIREESRQQTRRELTGTERETWANTHAYVGWAQERREREKIRQGHALAYMFSSREVSRVPSPGRVCGKTSLDTSDTPVSFLLPHIRQLLPRPTATRTLSLSGRGAQPPLAASPGLLDAGQAGLQTRLESNAYAGATTNGTQNLRMQCTNNQMQGECNTTRGDVMMESRSQRAVIGKQTVSSPDSSERPNNNNYVCDAKCTENAMRCDRDRDRYTTQHSDPTPTRHHPTAPGRWASTPGDSQVKHGHRRPGLLVVRAQTASPSWRG